MGVRDRNPSIKIYAPPHFKATWRKFLEIARRDGQSASELIRIWVEGYVARKDPGNPQRPITSWVPGHEDEQAIQFQELVKKLHAIASLKLGELSWWTIMEELEEAGYAPGRPRMHAAERIARELHRRGVKVWMG